MLIWKWSIFIIVLDYENMYYKENKERFLELDKLFRISETQEK